MSGCRLFWIAGSLALAAASAGAGEFLNLTLRMTENGHELLSAQRFRAPQTDAAAWNAAVGPQLGWRLHDAQGAVLAQGAVADPRVIRGLLEPGKGHAVVVLSAAQYTLRVPADARATDLRLLGMPPRASSTKRASAHPPQVAPGVPQQRLDVRGLMQAPMGR